LASLLYFLVMLGIVVLAVANQHPWQQFCLKRG